MKRISNIILGFLILISFYIISLLIIKVIHISLTPAILGLILFAFCLIEGVIKEEWVKPVCNILINNMAMFIVPFMGGLVMYKELIKSNWLVILVVIFVTTTITIVMTGLFVEYGLKYLRLHRMKKHND